MPCQKQLTLSPASGDYPLDDAAYVPTIDKILGTMGPYVIKFNATSGAPETFARVNNGRGPCHICYHAPTQMCYVSIWNEQSNQYYGTTTQPGRDIFPVTPSTLAIGARFGLDSRFPYPPTLVPFGYRGPRFLKSVGNYVYFICNTDGFSYICRANPTNLADFWNQATLTHYDEYMMEQFGADATNIYFPKMDLPGLVYFEQADYTTWDYVRAILANRPITAIVAVEFCANPAVMKAYGVSGNKYMLRADDFPTNGHAIIDFSSADDLTPTPLRIRYRSTDGFLYLPSASTDKITVWDPSTETVSSVKTGFDSPWDVVFTPTKAFAVQKGPIGLKEIT